MSVDPDALQLICNSLADSAVMVGWELSGVVGGGVAQGEFTVAVAGGLGPEIFFVASTDLIVKVYVASETGFVMRYAVDVTVASSPALCS